MTIVMNVAVSVETCSCTDNLICCIMYLCFIYLYRDVRVCFFFFVFFSTVFSDSIKRWKDTLFIPKEEEIQ